jgi:hypothetical protein
VTDAFLLQHVVPNIRKWFSADVALVLAKPLLWMIFLDGSTYHPETMRNRVRAAYENICVPSADENPVEKVMLVVTGFEGEVYLDEIGNENDRNQWRHDNNKDQLLALHSQMAALQCSVEEIKATQEEHHLDGRHEFQLVQSNIRQIAIQPVIRRAVAANEANDGEAGGAMAQVSTLSPNPRSLYLLWDEYENGIVGTGDIHQILKTLEVLVVCHVGLPKGVEIGF